MSEPTRVRCKLQVSAHKKYAHGDGTVVTLSTQYDESIPEDRRFARYTPSGQLEITVDNPSALAVLGLGRSFYLDLTPADPVAVATQAESAS